MRSLKYLVVACGLACTLWASTTSAARAADMNYAVVAISNPTNSTLSYAFRWGADSEWKTYTLKPGDRVTHWYRYEHANQNRSPVPQVNFDMDLSENNAFQTYDLEAYASTTNTHAHAKKYQFTVRASGRLVDLLSVN